VDEGKIYRHRINIVSKIIHVKRGISSAIRAKKGKIQQISIIKDILRGDPSPKESRKEGWD